MIRLLLFTVFITCLMALPFDVQDMDLPQFPSLDDDALIYLTEDSEMMDHTTDDNVTLETLPSPNHHSFTLASPAEAQQERIHRLFHQQSLADYQDNLPNDIENPSETALNILQTMK